MGYYHGTSSYIEIAGELLPPLHSDILREKRGKNKDVVFLTKSKVSAGMYAKKACSKFGGEPVVYTAIPNGLSCTTHNGEIICDKAIVINKEFTSTKGDK